MYKQNLKKSLIVLVLVLFVIAGCADNKSENQYSDEIDALKKEIDILNDRISMSEQMQKEIGTLKEEFKQLNAKKDVNLKASVYSCRINEADIEVTIDFNKENDTDREISFIVLSGDINNQCISGGYNVIRYNEVIIPGKGVLGTDDVPKNVKRYLIVFPIRSDYVYHIIAIDKNTGSIWEYDLNSSMMSDI